MLRRPLLWSGLAALLLVAGVASLFLLRGVAVTTQLVRRADLEEHVVASGRVMPPARVNVSTIVSGMVIAVGAIEGQHVKAGDLLVQIDDAEARNQVAQAKAAVAQASARVDQLRRVGRILATESLGQAQTNLAKATADLDRAQKLASTGAATRVEVENARRAVELARAQKNASEAQQAASQPMGADSRVALTAMMHAEAQLEGAMVRLAQTRLVAVHDGTILTRTVEPGDVVQPGRTLLTMASDGDERLVFHPDERNLALIALGQKARAAADAFPQDVFDAEVSYIAPAVDAQRGSIEVRLRVPTPPSFLRPDMTVSVDLTVAQRKQVLSVAREAIRGVGTATPWVLEVEGGHAVRRDVKLGILGDGAIEIQSGLREGAEVIVGATAVAPGKRVRTSKRD